MANDETKCGGNSDLPYIVGIGASAGGLEALEQMLERMPIDTGMAFVVVQHLSPDFKSVMDEVLSRRTSIPIKQVTDGMYAEPNTIYLMPSRAEMVISNGRLLLSEKESGASFNFPIDHFFRSLAQDAGRRAVGIILSGTGSDGSRGIVDIHAAGGLVIGQRENTAKFDGMPRNARETGCVDLFLAPQEIAGALMQIASRPRVNDLPSGLHPQLESSSALHRVLQALCDAEGVDFSYYKMSTVLRRIERRMAMHNLFDLEQYASHLASKPEEAKFLFHDMLIGVTRFFRDAEAFQTLADQAVETLIDEVEEGSEIRIWVTGCATGEEAYSIAFLLDEHITRRSKAVEFKIFATDVDDTSLETASHGIYSAEHIRDIPEAMVGAYFTRVGTSYKVNADIRRRIVFAPHNLISDAPFTKMDLISCRNLLIYLQPNTQSKILSLFHFGLRKGGFLFLGPSETTGDTSDEFESIDGHWKIFRKRRDVRLSRLTRFTPSRWSPFSGGPVSSETKPSKPDVALTSIYDTLLQRVVPDSILIGGDGTLLHTFGNAGRFFKAEQGGFTSDAYSRLASELRLTVMAAVRKSLEGDVTVTYSGVPLTDQDGEVQYHDVTAHSIRDDRRRVSASLVEIKPSTRPDHVGETFLTAGDASGVATEQLTVLETELHQTRENLQATIEELETSNEELQATNEELVSSNEELQSTNEELHSVNEELYSVNAEHQAKIRELSELTRDMNNLLESTEVHTLFLDAELRIRKFTPGFAAYFNLLPLDIGRRIDGFSHSLEADDFIRKAEEVIRAGQPSEQEVQDREGRWFLLRMLPYRDHQRQPSSDAIVGVLLTLVEITNLKKALFALEEAVRQRDEFLAMLSHELRNPLSAILNATHVLAMSLPREQQAEAGKIIQRQSRHMATLLDDLLDVARVSQGKIVLQRRPVDLIRVAHLAAESIMGRIQQRSQTLEIRVPETSAWIQGNESRLIQIITNLLTNASKYSADEGHIELGIADEGPQVMLYVRDFGIGILPENIEKVFELFVQTGTSLDRLDGGLGIGLTLVKALVELHDGSVKASSEGEGKGTTFEVRFPKAAPERPAVVEPESSQKRPSRIVLVDDNVDTSKLLAFLLEEAGFEVMVAFDGRTGLRMIQETVPHAAIVDIGLPLISGYDLAQRVREQQETRHVYLVALTGYGQPADREKALASGFDEHLVKPVDPDRLCRLLLRSKGQRRSQEDI